MLSFSWSHVPGYTCRLLLTKTSVDICPPELARSRLHCTARCLSVQLISLSGITHCSYGTHIVLWSCPLTRAKSPSILFGIEQILAMMKEERKGLYPYLLVIFLFFISTPAWIPSLSSAPTEAPSDMLQVFLVLEKLLAGVDHSPLSGDRCVHSPAHCCFDSWFEP